MTQEPLHEGGLSEHLRYTMMLAAQERIHG